MRERSPRWGAWSIGAMVILVVAGCTDGTTDDAVADGEVADPGHPGEVEQPEPEPEPEPDPGPDPEPDPEPEPALGAYGVSAGDTTAVEAGMQMLEAGGTAVDAAIAAAFAVSVVEPFASGIGGGGATLVVTVDGEADSYDYREVVAVDGTIPASETGIPGFVAGMAALHEEHGVLAWEDLLDPAIRLADGGTPTTSIVDAQLRSAAHRLPIDTLPEFFPQGQPLARGDLLLQPELADSLRVIAAEGAAAIHGGALGERLAAEVDGIDLGSLEGYEVQRTEPARGAFADHEIVAAAPPLPGAALIQLLQVAEALDIADTPPGSADHVHRLAMAWRVADRSVSSVLGDPEFTDVPVDELTDQAENAELATTIPGDALLAVSAPGPGSATVTTAASPEDDAGNTTHITTVDEDGTVVSMTNTLTNFWGSGQRVDGIFLNNQLSRFSIGGEANTPEPGRRSVSWSLPLVVLDDQSRPVLGIGSPGGRRIPTIEAGVLVRWVLHDEPLAEAVQADRIHLEGNLLQFETLPGDEVAADLRARGYADLEVPTPVYYFGSVQALEVEHDAGTVTGAVDPRRDGDWDSSSR